MIRFEIMVRWDMSVSTVSRTTGAGIGAAVLFPPHASDLRRQVSLADELASRLVRIFIAEESGEDARYSERSTGVRYRELYGTGNGDPDGSSVQRRAGCRNFLLGPGARAASSPLRAYLAGSR